jgi:hypothetical protein
MLLVNGVAIAMVVIGAVNSGRQPISNFPAKNIFWGIFYATKKTFRGFLRQIECEVSQYSTAIFCRIFYPFSCVQNK